MSDSGWQYFSIDELSCPCCGKHPMDSDFMRKVVAMRRECGFPFPVTSAYRCPEYNDALYREKGFEAGSHLAGPHTTGKAMDIAVSGHQAHALLSSAFRHGIKGIGISQKGPHNKRFIHIDTVDNGPRPWVWSY